MTKTAREVFEEKMKMVEEANGIHPKMKLFGVAGPENAEIFYEQMFACFNSGVEYGKLYK